MGPITVKDSQGNAVLVAEAGSDGIADLGEKGKVIVEKHSETDGYADITVITENRTERATSYKNGREVERCGLMITHHKG
jgi:hypothetical protein